MKRYWFLFMFLLPSCAFAQHLQGANWLFGGNGNANIPGTHLNFSNKSLVGIPFQYDYNLGEGVATISDKNGKLLFFSSMGHISTRIRVNNKYQEMPNGNVFIGINQTTTAELITKDPTIDSLYYIFFITNHGNGFHDLYVAKVDMRMNNGLGDVVPNSLRILKRKVAPGMAAMLHANNQDIWLVTQNAASDSMQAHLINASGISSPIYSLTKNPRTNPYYSYTRIKGSTNSELIVAKGATERQVKVYDFDRSLGTVSVKHVLTLSNPNQGGYSYAFSPDNSKLYVGTFQYSGSTRACFIYQYDLAAGATQLVQQSSFSMQIPTNSDFVIDMQVALDGKIYISRHDTVMFLSRINCPNLSGSASSFQLRAVKILGGDSSMVILPALNQTIFRNAGVLQAQAFQDTICQGDSVQLLAYGAGAEHFQWQVANGLTAPTDTLANPVVKPTTTTTYRVIGNSSCNVDTAYVKVTVVGPPKPIIITGPFQVYIYADKKQYSVQNSTTGNKYIWEVKGGTIDSGQGTGRIFVNWGAVGEGVVRVREIMPAGCIGEETNLKVEILNGPEPVIYNVFTPDNDGKNDSFVIENLKWYPENELKIYNRWGVEVYKVSNYKNNWQAENVSAGVYYYFFTSNGKSWKGWVEVLK